MLSANLNWLFVEEMGNDPPEALVRLPRTAAAALLGGVRLLERALRLGVHCATALDEQTALISVSDHIYRFDVARRRLVAEMRWPRPFRPLCFCRAAPSHSDEATVFFGGYGNNPRREPVPVWTRSPGGSWREWYTFPAGTIEHVHALVDDPHRDCLWILTGDYGSAAAIWRADRDARAVRPIIRGTQSARAAMAHVVKEGLLYATDSHLEANAIRLLTEGRDGWVSTPLFPMEGSSISSARVGEDVVFSTAVEPPPPRGNILLDTLDLRSAPGIVSPTCRVVVGNLARGFRETFAWPAYHWPKRLFQFSTIQFPDGHSNRYLCMYGVGVVGHDGVTEVYTITDEGH